MVLRPSLYGQKHTKPSEPRLVARQNGAVLYHEDGLLVYATTNRHYKIRPWRLYRAARAGEAARFADEGAALDWTETVTTVSETHVPIDAFEHVRQQFNDTEIVKRQPNRKTSILQE